MKRFFKFATLLIALVVMFVAWVFIIPSAYADVIDQPAFTDGDLLFGEEGIAQPLIQESDLLVTPANLPSHLKLYKDNLINTDTNGFLAKVIAGNKGGFQRIEIVRLTKFRNSSIRVRTGTGV